MHLVQYVQNKIQALSKGAHLNGWHWEIGTQKEAATCSRRCGWGGLGTAPRSFQVAVHVLNQDSLWPEDHYDLDPSNLHVVWSRALEGLRSQEPDVQFGNSPFQPFRPAFLRKVNLLSLVLLTVPVQSGCIFSSFQGSATQGSSLSAASIREV